MRKLAVVFALALLPLGTAQAQFCPGAAPYVFTDVLANDSFCGFITRMAVDGITTGCQIIDANNRRFCPDDFVTRKQMSAFIIRGADAQFPLSCAAGQVMKWNGLDWACADDNIGGSGGGGTVTSVAAGTGLAATPNPIVGAGSINLAPSYQLPQACANGQVPKSNGSGGWACAADNDTNSGGTVTSVNAGAGLSGGNITSSGTIAIATGGVTTAMLAQSGCTNGQVLKWNGSAWACAADDAGPANAFVQSGNAFGATAVLGTTDNNALDVRVNNSRVMRFEPMISPNVVGGHVENVVDAGVRGAVIAGGGILQGTDPVYGAAALNRVTDHYGVVGGGANNRAGNANGALSDAVWATVAGGNSNVASGGASAIGGGGGNTASAPSSTVAGGNQNQATDTGASVAGGQFNRSMATYAAVGGGENNSAMGSYAAVPGGRLNSAGSFSFAAGRRAKANYQGAFLWADSTDLDFKVQASEFTGPGSGWLDAANTFNVRATGGVWLVTGVDGVTGRPTVGAHLNAGEGTWNVTSDAASKRDVYAVDPQEVLAKALTIEVSRWRYRTAPGIVHIGPMAQDFHRAFNVGSDERSIATVDADGVALAAIQGLNAKLEAKVAAKDTEIAALKERLAQVETSHSRDMADLRLAVEVLMARTSTEGRVAQTR